MVSALGLTSCAMGPDYERPELNLPKQYQQPMAGNGEDLVERVDATEVAALSWRKFYQDPELIKLIEHALSRNLDLKVAQSRLLAARSKMTVVDSNLWPEISLNLGYERTFDSAATNTDPVPETTLDLTGALSWEIDLWGENRRASEAAQADYLSEVEKLRLIYVSLISDIASRYYEWLDIEQRFSISSNTVALRQKELEIAKLRHTNGVISGLDVRQAEVELQSTKVTLPKLDYERQNKINQLYILLGEYDYPLPLAQGLPENVGLPYELNAGVPSELLNLRPDVKISEQQMIAANAEVGVAKTAFFPKFTISGVYGRENNHLKDIFDSEGVTWSLLGGVTTPIFNRGRVAANYDIANEASKQAVLNYRSTVLNAYFDVNDSINNLRRAELAITSLKELLISTQEYARLARLRYQNGVATSLDLMDSQRQLFSAQLAYSQILRDKQLAKIALYRALGGGQIE
ncbi:efflux transporter outer membrane subunit [Shewanella acanthi]|uniref:efflux transporter outer membrane subunit n=1 Tax=Shewanella acanthi TaxID=2864212 RepID=UPI0021AC45C9|nr:efflux transporter outer membrane subunit [Shewanella acanthi]